jgi:hypothetical protein
MRAVIPQSWHAIWEVEPSEEGAPPDRCNRERQDLVIFDQDPRRTKAPRRALAEVVRGLRWERREAVPIGAP